MNCGDYLCAMEADSGQQETPSCHATPRRGGIAARSFLRRTPLSGGRGVHSGFKSPVQRSAAQQVSPEQEAEQLRQKGAELDSQIAQLHNEGMNIEELDEHIELLHEYNDIKDAAQTLLGQLARVRGVTTAELYSQFGLELED